MRDEDDEDLIRLASSVADGTQVDWDSESLARPEQSGLLEQLRAVESVAARHRAGAPEPVPETVWGSLRLLERIGQGGFGDVFRAFDPVLQREVALKLWREDRAPPGATRQRYVAEARRLARVRHPNVVIVYGADEHEGRVGLWTELVRGATLEECLQRQGTFAAHEAAQVGISLCRALAAVHAAGLIHRDVKASNVMREEGGRIVLLDLGAGGETFEGRAADGSLSGTLHSMAPEQLRGDAVGSAADIYSLGVLLYRLVSGRHPVEAHDVAELLAKQERGERTPLREAKPDLPPAFVEVVEHALAQEPGRRFASAAEMESALNETLVVLSAPEPAGSSRGSPRSWLVIVTVVVVLVAVGIAGTKLWHGPSARQRLTAVAPRGLTASPGAPNGAGTPARSQAAVGLPLARAPLRATIAFFRIHAGAVERLTPGARIATGDSLYLTIEGTDAMHVYVLDEDEQGKIFVLFPLAGLDMNNPLRPRALHRLPGTRAGRTVDWQVTSAGGRENIAVIAARSPLTSLEQEIGQIPAAAASRSPQFDTTGDDAATRLRGVGGVVEEPEPQPYAGRLSQIVRRLARSNRGPEDPWVWQIVLENPGR